MNGITTVGGEFYGDGSSTKPFQSLETLRFEAMLEWVEWYILGVEEFSQLKELCVIECPKLVGGLPKQVPSWVRLEIRECSALTASLPRTSVANEQVLNGCNGVDLGWQGVSFPEGMHSPFPSLEELIIWNCPEIESFPEGSNLRRLQIWNCEKLVACRREWGLQRLPSLTDFTFGGGKYEEEDDDDVLESFLEEGLLPPTLTSLGISNLQNLKSINYQSFQHLTCLKVLRICNCPQLQSLPEEGFLPSLYRLEIDKCPLLKPRCERDRGDEWHKITHIPFIKIDGDEWHKIARTSVKSSSANCSTLPKHQTSQLS
ncbi:putative disease resistance protein [Camellia lanceoleosa]|uniref:Disease resistance protein n=1 Tax=Camellia lanceoleosa TaxID=1840588 RepID=A0ACC0IRF1_9ERIC|nr:putative disease resistance protein [Camellia lanceoleosa]